MNTAGRLGLYGAGLVVIFGAAFATAGAVVPETAVASWTERGATAHPDEHEQDGRADGAVEEEDGVNGTALAASGFVLGAITAPSTVDTEGTLSFVVSEESGAPVTAFETAHDKELHLIVVRTDGSGYRHVHPELDEATGTWSLPWRWDAAGTYRAYADFTAADGTSATLSRTVEVAGTVRPEEPTDVGDEVRVAGFDVTLRGELRAGAPTELTAEITRDGAPVTTLEPYLGAFGHLVALRQGDLAYLHVHAHGDEPQPDELAGPDVTFTAVAPTAGRYLLYLDFQVDGEVHTAAFVLDAAVGDDGGSTAEHDGH
ncbi:heavy metal-binding domain-containing protein [Zhihengliuella sp. ISTPL4]|uniref:heavy metal-binding domain-containing protein n=1 Tax=Zhihengliuella sp. ISTPL4 TaxID=2058657 RepID=UPI000C7E7B08|nr:heavy metal-binding domain-containing protein [Zhihengliuella sp. ISTPL4]